MHSGEGREEKLMKSTIAFRVLNVGGDQKWLHDSLPQSVAFIMSA